GGCGRGMGMVGYEINIENRIGGKRMWPRENRHFDRTKPLAAPSSEEIRAAGIAIYRLLRSPCESLGHTMRKVSSDSESGSCHIFDGLTCDGSLKAVTRRT